MRENTGLEPGDTVLALSGGEPLIALDAYPPYDFQLLDFVINYANGTRFQEGYVNQNINFDMVDGVLVTKAQAKMGKMSYAVRLLPITHEDFLNQLEILYKDSVEFRPRMINIPFDMRVQN